MHKGWAQISAKLRITDCIVEIHDARIPFTGRNPKFGELLRIKPHLIILNKADLADLKNNMGRIHDRMKQDKVDKVLFSNCLIPDSRFITKEVLPSVMEVIHSRPRYNRAEVCDYNIMVVGVPNVGKSTFINLMKKTHTTLKKKSLQVGAIAGVTRGLSGKIRVSFDPDIYLLDTPGILTPQIGDVETGLKLALCGCLPDHLIGEEFIVDYMLYWMNKHGYFEYVKYYDLEGPTENVLGFLSLLAKREKWVKRLRSQERNEMIFKPDFQKAARKVISAFRTGELGKYMLD